MGTQNNLLLLDKPGALGLYPKLVQVLLALRTRRDSVCRCFHQCDPFESKHPHESASVSRSAQPGLTCCRTHKRNRIARIVPQLSHTFPFFHPLCRSALGYHSTASRLLEQTGDLSSSRRCLPLIEGALRSFLEDRSRCFEYSIHRSNSSSTSAPTFAIHNLALDFPTPSTYPVNI